MKIQIIFFFLVFFILSCSSQQKNQLKTKRVSLLPNDKDTILFKPENDKSTNQDTLIFYFHGSGGPNRGSAWEAITLAKYGFQVVHLCWFNCNRQYNDDLEAIEEINLKAIAQKISNIAHTLKTKKIIFVGISRGAELAALLVSNQQLFDIEISKAVILSGINVTANARMAIPRKVLSDRLAHPQPNKIDPYLSSKSAWMIDDVKISRGSIIKVEKFTKPLMIIHGDQDKLWSVEGAFKLIENYEKNGLKAMVKIMPNTGHIFPPEDSEAFKSLIQFFKD